MTKRRPKISVLMSVFNAENYLKKAVESILEQSFSDFEFIIIDDCSTDKSLKILQSYKDSRIKIIRNRKKLGLTRSLNKGLKVTNGEFIARMDADDISLKKRLERQFNYLKTHSKIAFCGSWVTLINQRGKRIGQIKYPVRYEEIKKVILRFNPFVHPTVMIRKKILDEVAVYDESLNGAEDYDLFLRLAKNYQGVNLPNFLLKYRISPQAISFRQYKKTERQALRARWKAITQHGYAWWQTIYLIKPLISFLLPGFLKRIFYEKHFGVKT